MMSEIKRYEAELCLYVNNTFDICVKDNDKCKAILCGKYKQNGDILQLISYNNAETEALAEQNKQLRELVVEYQASLRSIKTLVDLDYKIDKRALKEEVITLKQRYEAIGKDGE